MTTSGTIPGCYPPGLDPFAVYEMLRDQRIRERIPTYPAPVDDVGCHVVRSVMPLPPSSFEPVIPPPEPAKVEPPFCSRIRTRPHG